MSTVSAATTPSTAPSVFQPYSQPTMRPKSVRDRDRAPTRTGSVAPIAVAGAIITTKATISRIALTTGRPAPAVTSATIATSGGNPEVSATPVSAPSPSSETQ